jgi:PEGA domain-containing protein
MPSGGSGDGAVGSPGGGAAGRGPLIHVNTRCDSLEDFVDKFAGLASEGALVLPASSELPIGTEGRFAIRLRDQSVAMRGRCRVTGARPAPSVPAGGGPRATLLRVVLLDMEEESASMHRRLLARRRAAVPVPIPPALSEPTIVSPPRPEVTAPPPFRVPPPPPVSGRAATMIGMTPVGRAGSPFIDTRASPPAETRVPGASFTLPANPLSELDATDLASFIDSTLLESGDEDATVVREGGSAGGDDETLEQLAPPRAAEIAVEPTAPTMVDSSPVRVRGPVAGKTRVETVERSERIRAIFRRAAPYLVCTIVGIGIGRLVIHSTPKTVSRVPPTAPVSPVVEKLSMPAAGEQAAPPPRDPPSAPPTETPQRTTAVAAHRDAPAGRVSAGAEGCSARVLTEPRDAKVSWGDQTLGKTPIGNVKIPCGAGVLTIVHERYQTVTREVTVEAGTPVAVSERLHRPPATLIVGSSPAGAAISVNGQALGAAPRRLPTSRYEHVSIRATLAGYSPWTKKVYLTEATTKVTAQLSATHRGR